MARTFELQPGRQVWVILGAAKVPAKIIKRISNINGMANYAVDIGYPPPFAHLPDHAPFHGVLAKHIRTVINVR